jgi:hypothetical protein
MNLRGTSEAPALPFATFLQPPLKVTVLFLSVLKPSLLQGPLVSPLVSLLLNLCRVIQV